MRPLRHVPRHGVSGAIRHVARILFPEQGKFLQNESNPAMFHFNLVMNEPATWKKTNDSYLLVERFEKFYRSNKSTTKKKKRKNITNVKKRYNWKIIHFVESHRESFLFPPNIHPITPESRGWISVLLSIDPKPVPNDLIRCFYTDKFYFSFHACSAISPRMIRYPRNGSGRIRYLNFMVRAL